MNVGPKLISTLRPTTMSSPHLPPETLDYILDLLHDDAETLKDCCLVTKSFVPRTRKHLFSRVELDVPWLVDGWKKTFPDPAISPAYHTRYLFIGFFDTITRRDLEEGGWITSFSNVTQLVLNGRKQSPSKSLAIICSLPLLEDLEVTGYSPDPDDWSDAVMPAFSTSPPLTGTLNICEPLGMGSTSRALLNLPDGIRFREFICTWYLDTELQRVSALLEKCSDSLECLDLKWATSARPLASIDLSKLPMLSDLVLRSGGVCILWIIIALKSITPNNRHLRISIHTGISFRRPAGEEIRNQWLDLDHVLIQLSESNAAKIRLLPDSVGMGEEACECIEQLLPETARRGMAEIVRYPPHSGSST